MQRFVFIGIDAADRTLLRRWAGEGVLPTFRRLLQTGAVAECRSPWVFYVGAQWPSFYTGLNTAGHGRYCYEQLAPGTYDSPRFPASSIAGTPFWDPLSEQGRTFTVIDVPKTVLSRRLRGTQIVDWTTHDPEAPGFCAAPAAERAEVAGRYGGNPDDNCNRQERTAEGFARFRERLKDRVGRKERLLGDYLERGGWDAFVCAFADSHCAGHQGWHLHDPSHDRHDAELAAAAGNPVRDAYAAIDGALGRLLAKVPQDCVVAVLASHGMGPHWDGTHLMDEVLARLDAALPHGRAPRASRAVNAARERLQHIRPWRMRKHMPRPLSHRAFRKVFWIPNNEAWLGLRLNLEGREPLGRIRPAEQAPYAAALMQALAELRVGAPDGPPAFSEIATTREHLQGALIDTLPDIVARWTRHRPFTALCSPLIGRVEGSYKGVRTGDHMPDGLLMVAGPGIAAGDRPACAVEDLAPSFAAMLGGRLGPGDGRALDWLRPAA